MLGRCFFGAAELGYRWYVLMVCLRHTCTLTAVVLCEEPEQSTEHCPSSAFVCNKPEHHLALVVFRLTSVERPPVLYCQPEILALKEWLVLARLYYTEHTSWSLGVKNT